MGRGFEVITCLATLSAQADGRVSGPGASVGDVARALGRDRSQVSRILAALADQQLVVRGPDRRYSLTWGWYAAAQELTERRLRSIGLGVLEALSAEVGEACFLGVLQGDSTRTIAESVPAGSGLIGSWIDRSYPAFCSDAGQAVLWDAGTDEIRDVFARTRFESTGPNAPRSVDEFVDRLEAARLRGYAVISEEAEPGLFAVATPVFDFRGEVVAGLQVVGTRQALEARTLDLAAACMAASTGLSAALGAPGVTARYRAAAPTPATPGPRSGEASRSGG
ncbi:IclR family transcriptional regulator [Plantibacter sp. RU18]